MEMSSILLALLGGALIGASASAMLYFNGKVAGISDIVGGLLSARRSGGWRILFVMGLLVGGAMMLAARPAAFSTRGLPGGTAVVIAGLLVGFGTRLGNGCTSGHGVCGNSRLSRRSIAATLVFIAAGVVTVAIVRLLVASR